MTIKELVKKDKQIIDVVTKYIHDDLGISSFDDSLFLDVYFTKSIIPKSSSEYIAIQIRESKHNPRFDIIDVPENIYLPDSGLKKGFRKYAKDNSLAVKFYSDAKDREKCNTEIEYLSPEITGGYINLGSSFARITEHISYIKSCENKFYWLGILGDSESWGPEVWKIIESWCSQLIDIIGDCSRIRVRYINKEEDILI